MAPRPGERAGVPRRACRSRAPSSRSSSVSKRRTMRPGASAARSATASPAIRTRTSTSPPRRRPTWCSRSFRRTVPSALEHGTVGVLDDEGGLHEVTTFRRDVHDRRTPRRGGVRRVARRRPRPPRLHHQRHRLSPAPSRVARSVRRARATSAAGSSAPSATPPRASARIGCASCARSASPRALPSRSTPATWHAATRPGRRHRPPLRRARARRVGQGRTHSADRSDALVGLWCRQPASRRCGCPSVGCDPARAVDPAAATQPTRPGADHGIRLPPTADRCGAGCKGSNAEIHRAEAIDRGRRDPASADAGGGSPLAGQRRGRRRRSASRWRAGANPAPTAWTDVTAAIRARGDATIASPAGRHRRRPDRRRRSRRSGRSGARSIGCSMRCSAIRRSTPRGTPAGVGAHGPVTMTQPSLFTPPEPLAARMRPRTLEEFVGQARPARARHAARRRHPPRRRREHHPLGAARHRQDDAGPTHRALHRPPVRRLQRRHRGRAAGARDPPRGRGPPASGPGHDPLLRRDPPLQPRPAGRVPAAVEQRHHHADRRHHREPVVRAQRRAAVPLPGVGAGAAGRRGPARRHRPRARRRRARAGRDSHLRHGRRRAGRCSPRSPTATRAGRSRCSRRRRSTSAPAADRTAEAFATRWRGGCRSSTRTASSTTT